LNDGGQTYDYARSDVFRDEFIIMVERLDVLLFIWKQKEGCVDMLEKGHNFVSVTIFMSAVRYM
jgi:hypothetical protein